MQLVTFEQRSLPDAHSDLRPARRPAALSRDLDLGRVGRRRVGAVLASGPHAGDIVDLNRALVLRLAEEDVGAPEVEANSLLPCEMQPFLAQGPGGLRHAADALAWTADALGRYDAPDLLRSGALHARRTVSLCPPIPHPGKLIGVTDNYRAQRHRETAWEVPQHPRLCLESPTALLGPEDDIVLLPFAQPTHAGGTLAVVIGATARNVRASDALRHVAGYTIANDLIAFELEREIGSVARSFDGSTPMGPAIMTVDAIDDPQDLAIRTQLSGRTLHQARTREMLFPVAELIAFASRLMTLEAGDVLLTGTPPAVGEPVRPLRDGDVLDVEIERIGLLRSHVRTPHRSAGERTRPQPIACL